MSEKNCRVFAIVNRKGGVGKTTTAIALAQGLAQKIEEDGGRVLLIDFDPQGNVTASLQLEKREHDISNLLLNDCTLKECIVSAHRPEKGLNRPNLFIIPSSDELAEVKSELMIKSAIGGRKATPVADVLQERLGGLRQLFDFIVVDCPPTLDIFSDAVYNFADEAIVPVKADFLGEIGTGHHTQNIIEAQKDGIDIKINCILPTFFDPRLTIARSVLSNLVNTYGRKAIAYPIPRSTMFEQSPALDGQTIFELKPNSTAAKAYRSLVDRVYES